MLSYSRRLFVKAFLNERQDDWREGIAAAFTHFGGVPRTLLGDNARALVVGRDRATGTVRLSSGLSGLLPRLGRAAARLRAVSRADQGQDRSGREIREAQRRWPDQAFASFAALETHLARVDGAGRRARPRDDARGADRSASSATSAQALRPLPLRALPRREQRLRRRVAHDAFVDVDTVRYSVPHRLVRDHVEVVVDEQTVRIFHGTHAGRDARADRASRSRAWSIRRTYAGLWRPAAPDERRDRAAGGARARPRRLRRRRRGRWPMSVVVHARVVEQLTRLRLRYVAERLDAVLNDAARTEPTYLDFPRQRPAPGGRRQAAHARHDGAQDRALSGGEDARRLRFQIPAVGRSAARARAGDRRASSRQAENVLIFGAPGVGKTHLAIALGRAVVEAGHSVLFTSATALLAALAKAETDGQLADRLMFYSKPKLLIIDELGYLPFERRSAHLFFQLVARRYERGSLLITTNQVVTQWGTVFGDEVLAAAILDRLLHHSHTLMIQGESYRLRQKKKAGLLGRTPRHDG